jgi:hypothetical protein
MLKLGCCVCCQRRTSTALSCAQPSRCSWLVGCQGVVGCVGGIDGGALPAGGDTLASDVGHEGQGMLQLQRFLTPQIQPHSMSGCGRERGMLEAQMVKRADGW